MRIIYIFLFVLSSSFLTGQSLYDDVDAFLENVVTEEGFVDYIAVDRTELDALVTSIKNKDLTGISTNNQAAFYINAYNILVINKIIQEYPNIKSVKDVAGFFTRKQRVAGANMGLDGIEKKVLSLYPSGDVHMILNCGAKSCPPLHNKAFRGYTLEAQITEVAEKAAQQYHIIDPYTGKISNIFNWYADDFAPDVESWITERLRKEVTPTGLIPYDWSLNDINAPEDGETRYFASNLYASGAFEVGMFNNYYTQKTGIEQADWFTSTATFLYGINKRINIGLDLRIRSTQIGNYRNLQNFGALNFPRGYTFTNNEGQVIRTQESGLSAVGLRLKYQPYKEQSNLTFQHIIYVPTFSESNGFLDWDSPYIFNDVYYDRVIGAKSSIFFSGGLYIENINKSFFWTNDGYYQVSTPMNLIYSYFPNKKTTVYLLGNIAPKVGFNTSGGGTSTSTSWSPFGQLGVGYKYFITKSFQVELLYTEFFDNEPNRTARTFNLGLRYYKW